MARKVAKELQVGDEVNFIQTGRLARTAKKNRESADGDPEFEKIPLPDRHIKGVVTGLSRSKLAVQIVVRTPEGNSQTVHLHQFFPVADASPESQEATS